MSLPSSTALIAGGCALLAGALVSIQPVFNGRLGQLLGSPLKAALVSFTAGVAVLLTILLIFGARPPSAETASRVPIYLWFVGGALGAFFVTSSAWSAPRVGVGMFLALVVASQLICAVTLDHFGAFGMTERPLTLARIAGVALLIGGAALVTRG